MAQPELSLGNLLEQLSTLQRSRPPDRRLAVCQPLTLMWAFGRAGQGLARIAEWPETQAALGEYLERHGADPRPHYPVATLHHAGLWDPWR